MEKDGKGLVGQFTEKIELSQIVAPLGLLTRLQMMLKQFPMPIYEYECPKCGLFEVVQKTTAKPLKCKPDCSDPACPRAAKRLISAAAFHLKGSGWYKTDYASKSAVDAKKPAVKAVEKSDSGTTSESAPKASTEKSDSGSKTPS